MLSVKKRPGRRRGEVTADDVVAAATIRRAADGIVEK
jgi:hypothetical protein